MKNLTNILIGCTLFFSLCTFFSTCSNSSKIKTLNKQFDAKQKSDSVAQHNNSVMIQIEGYKISKRMLFGQNAVLRTTERPDDLMNQYDNEIGKLQKELK